MIEKKLSAHALSPSLPIHEKLCLIFKDFNRFLDENDNGSSNEVYDNINGAF